MKLIEVRVTWTQKRWSQEDGSLVCCVLNLKSLVPVVFKASSCVNTCSNPSMKSSKWCWQIKMQSVSLVYGSDVYQNTPCCVLTDIYRLKELKMRKIFIRENVNWDFPLLMYLDHSLYARLPQHSFSLVCVLLHRWQLCVCVCVCCGLSVHLCVSLEPPHPGAGRCDSQHIDIFCGVRSLAVWAPLWRLKQSSAFVCLLCWSA